MVLFYNTGLWVYAKLIGLASLFNTKAKLFVSGRAGLVSRIQVAMQNNKRPVIWVHCASLGEFEQGRPLIEALRKERSRYAILLTFFSPSGYEVRKNYLMADWVFYLPWDTARNARQFVDAVRPSLAIFVKYEFWFHYCRQLKLQDVPVLSVASIFRPHQLFFKTYGGFYRGILANFSHFFVQNFESLDLLISIGIGKDRATVTGDTRFDRVVEIAKHSEEIPLAAAFKAGEKLMVVGSAWEEDIAVLAPFINRQQGKMKFIIAPHEISEASLAAIERQLQKTTRFSMVNNAASYDVLIIDNVGMLSRLYKYGEYAYVGGGFGKGLHNILEAACYGVPVFFGNKSFRKFQEAVDLINRGGAFDVAGYDDLVSKYEQVSSPENFVRACEVTRSYVEENLGATEKIMNYCRNLLS